MLLNGDVPAQKRSSLKNWKGQDEGDDPGKDGGKKEKEIFKYWEWEDGELVIDREKWRGIVRQAKAHSGP